MGCDETVRVMNMPLGDPGGMFLVCIRQFVFLFRDALSFFPGGLFHGKSGIII